MKTILNAFLGLSLLLGVQACGGDAATTTQEQPAAQQNDSTADASLKPEVQKLEEAIERTEEASKELELLIKESN